MGVLSRLLVAMAAALVACSRSYAEGASDGGAAPDAAGGMLQAGDFEVPSCSGWSGDGATLADDPTAHGGHLSCRVCANRADPVWNIMQRLPTGIAPGTYVGSLWIRTAPDAAAATDVGAGLARYDGSGAYVDGHEAVLATIDATWRLAHTALVVPAESDGYLQFGVVVRAAGGCFLVDDATLSRSP